MTASARAVAFTVLLLVACRDASIPLQPGPQQSHDLVRQLAGPNVVPGQYIVVFKHEVDNPDALARTLVGLYGGSLKHTYTSALKGFAATLSDAAVAALQQLGTLVDYIEPDRQVTSDGGTQQMDANGDPWGLDRIDQQALPLSGTYTYTSTGAGVHAYIIDTGIWTLHTEFEGRADIVYDAVDPTGTAGAATGQDCYGHGTHVAGIVGAATYGVAKKVFLHGVRYSAYCDGLGLNSDVIAAVDWVTANHKSPAVANMSVFGDKSSALTTAVTTLWNSGVFVAIAAGNGNADACLSVEGTTGAFPVAASTRFDEKADFTNWGPCVKIYAPGKDILSTWLLNTTKVVSGTSMATPHVTGVAALYKATFGDAPSDVVADWIITNATTGVITGNGECPEFRAEWDAESAPVQVNALRRTVGQGG